MKCFCHRYLDALTTFEEVQTRCSESPKFTDSFESVARSTDGWREIQRCKVCDRLWAKEFPFAESHGGGLSCFYVITTDNLQKWLMESENLTAKLRFIYEDQKLFDSLVSDVGSEICDEHDCKNQSIAMGTKCRHHHFSMIKGRPYTLCNDLNDSETKTTQLVKYLEEIHTILSNSSTDQDHWKSWIYESIRRIQNTDFSGIEYFLSAFGGVGSFNEICPFPFSKTTIQTSEQEFVNLKFYDLRNKAYSLAREISREKKQ